MVFQNVYRATWASKNKTLSIIYLQNKNINVTNFNSFEKKFQYAVKPYSRFFYIGPKRD